MSSAAQIGIIGYGAIGRDLCDRLGREGHEVVLLLRAGSTSRESAPPGLLVVHTIEELIALRPQLVVEAAGQAVLDQMAESILRAGVSLIAASTGALGDPRLFSRLEAAAREAKTRLILPAGALGGLDYLAALRGESDATIRYTSRKPPAAWQAELAAAGHDPARLRSEIVLFEGAPAKAAQLYPRNLNAGLTVALAAAPAPVTVRVIADPAVSLNTHEIEAESAGHSLHALRQPALARQPENFCADSRQPRRYGAAAARTGNAMSAARRSLVIGAGIVGLCCARALLREGHAVTVIDRDPAGDKVSFGNAGGLGVTEILPAATPGVIWQAPRWLVDPLGPLSIRPTHLPRLLPWLARFLRSATAREAARIMRALAGLLAPVYEATGVDRGAVITASDEHIAFDRLVVAAGAWSGRMSRAVGDRVLVESERGYNATLPTPGVRLSREVIFAERQFVATPFEMGLRIGGAAEFAGLEAAPNWRRSEALMTLARRYLPDLDTRGARLWMGARPTTPDSLPVIGRSARQADVFYAFGHGHLGLTLGPTTGRLVADLVMGRIPSIDLAPFSITRFA